MRLSLHPQVKSLKMSEATFDQDKQEVKLDMETPSAGVSRNDSVNSRTPRIIHFQDGSTLDEALEDMEEEEPDFLDVTQEKINSVNWKGLGWASYGYHLGIYGAVNVLKKMDYAGSVISDFLGITSPKFESEINEARRQHEENMRIENEERTDRENWSADGSHRVGSYRENENNNGENVKTLDNSFPVLSSPIATSTPFKERH